ncbi:MAG: ABC transporter ATP-binding protein/permease [Salinivirgaceae bacterium]|nr:ABC transporter ATP-binding protein/permease [Salinivirgaceae bacterium]
MGLFYIIKRFAHGYWSKLILNLTCNVLSALFAVFSMAFIIPVMEILFGIQQEVTSTVPWELTLDCFKHNMSFFVTQVKASQGLGAALLYIGLFLIVATLLKTGFAYLSSYVLVGVRNGVVRDLRKNLYNKILHLPLGFYSDEHKGDIMSRAMSDVQEVENSIMSTLNMLLKNPVIIIVLLVSLFLMSVRLTLFIFLMLPIGGIIIGRVGKSLKKKSTEGQEKMGEIVGVLEETLGGLRVIKAFNAEDRMLARFDQYLNSYRRTMNKLTRRRDLAHPMSELLGTIIIVLVVWYGGSLIMQGNDVLEGAVFIAYIGIFYQIIVPAKEFSNAFYNVQRGIAALERIDRIMNADIAIREVENAKHISNVEKGIEYKNVSFAYDERMVLNNVSLNIKKGQTVALVGQSGSGKTTFVDLLPRFYDVNAGEILVDGVNIKNYTLFDLRELIGNVNQEAILFNDTIYNNITFGVENATQEQVEAAARVANAHEFIMSTEDGYQTIIGDRGSKLSGGQRQRLSIARAILKNPPILILDEATSALDTESERLVQDALEHLMANRTSIVIAHRLSTVRNADLICVLHEGCIIEQGTHDELMAKNGQYRKLHDIQTFA